ncbi:MAG TPA: helicase-associated domain-containing protein [Roseiflexaceae bacterium]|nr:helicase-associated domain-containing protein [Roseiflexaceae bacterium]
MPDHKGTPALTLRRWLAEQPELERAALARLWSLGDACTPGQLADAMLRPETVARVLAGLGSQERAALARVQERGGTIAAAALERDFGPVRLQDRHFYPNPRSYLLALPQPPTPAERLFLLGLIQPVRAGPRRLYAVPPDLLALLPSVLPRAAHLPLPPAAPPPETLPADVPMLERRLLELLELAHDAQLDVTPAGALTKASMVRVARRWGMDDNLKGVMREEQWPYLRFLRCIARAADLLRPGADAALRTTRAALEWLQLPRLERLRRLLEGWIVSDWDELAALEGIKAQRSFGRDLPAARRALLALLAPAPAEGWLDLEAFVAAVKAHEPDFARPDGEYDRWGLVGPAGQRLDGFVHWDAVEGAQIRDVLGVSLRWLGLVEAGLREGALVSFRLNGYGAALLGAAPAPQQPPDEPLVVQPNFEVLAPAFASPYARFQLGRIAEARTGHAATVYRLTRRSIQTALERGIAHDEIVRFLETQSGRPLPQNVAASLGEWAGRHGQLVLRRGYVLQAADPALLEQVRRDRRVRMPVAEPLGDSAWLMREGDAAELAERLRKAGYGLAGDAPRDEGRLSEHDLAVVAAALEFYAGAADALGLPCEASAALRRRVARLLPERQLNRAYQTSIAALRTLREQLGTH